MSSEVLDRGLVLEAVRVTEIAAIAAWKLVGRGDEKEADQAAVDAMRTAPNHLASLSGLTPHPMNNGRYDPFPAFALRYLFLNALSGPLSGFAVLTTMCFPPPSIDGLDALIPASRSG